MEINEEILEIFKRFKIYPDDGICYLMSIYYNYRPTYIPERLKKKIYDSNIIVKKGYNIQWKIPLYVTQETNFEWVKDEYIELFKRVNPDRRGSTTQCILRMKKLFAKHPEIRKDDVIDAANMYLLNTDPRYIRTSHYFIEKGIGGNKTSDLLDWIDRHKQEETAMRNVISDINKNKLQ